MPLLYGTLHLLNDLVSVFSIGNFIYVVLQLENYMTDDTEDCAIVAYPSYLWLCFILVQSFFIFKTTSVRIMSADEPQSVNNVHLVKRLKLNNMMLLNMKIIKQF